MGYGNNLAMQQTAPTFAASGAIAGRGIEERRPELAEYMERLACAITLSEELSDHINSRLSGVMRPVDVTGESGGPTPAGPSTYYGQQVQAAIDRIACVNGRLQDMLRRLEA